MPRPGALLFEMMGTSLYTQQIQPETADNGEPTRHAIDIYGSDRQDAAIRSPPSYPLVRSAVPSAGIEQAACEISTIHLDAIPAICYSGSTRTPILWVVRRRFRVQNPAREGSAGRPGSHECQVWAGEVGTVPDGRRSCASEEVGTVEGSGYRRKE